MKRMTHPVAILAAVLFWAASASIASAQDDCKQMLKEAYELVERGRYDEALKKLNEMLAKCPSSEDALSLRSSLQSEEWVRIAIANGQLKAVVDEVFSRARPAALAQTADTEAIKKLIEEARAGDHVAQRKALRTLMANHGDYAVAVLYKELGSSDTDRRVTTMQWLRELGSDAPMPLIQVLEASEPMVRMNAAVMLGIVRDPRAVPYLARVAEADADTTVKEAAAAALAKFGLPGAPVAQRYLELAERYYRRDPAVSTTYRAVYPVWSFSREGDSTALVAREVPRELHHLKLAEDVLFDLLAFDPSNLDAHVLLGSVLIAESEFGRDLKAEGDEAAIVTATQESRLLATTLGAATLDRVVTKAIADGRADVAEGACRLLTALITRDTFGGSNGLTAGLAAPFKSARFASALGVAAIDPRTDFTARERVVQNLAEALGQDATRNVLVIDDNSDSMNRILSDLNARQYVAIGASDGATGIQRLREYPIEDIVIIRYNMSGAPHVSAIVNAVRRDPRTEKTPIAMLVDPANAEAAKNEFQAHVQLFINSPPLADAYEPQLKALVASLDAGREAATMTAAAAATALENMDPKGSVLASASAAPALVATLKGDDRVRGPAIRALGKIGDGTTVPALLALVKDASVAEPLRADAIVSLAQISRAAGATSQEVMTTLREAYASQGSPDFMRAVARAVGIAPMSLKENVDVLNAGRPKAMIDQVK